MSENTSRGNKQRNRTQSLAHAPEHATTGTYSRADFIVGYAICGVKDLAVPKPVDRIVDLVKHAANEMNRQSVVEAIGNLLELGMIVQKGDGFMRAPHVVARQIQTATGHTLVLVEMCKNGQYTFMLPTEHQSKEWFGIVQVALDLECVVRAAQGTTLAAAPFSRLTYDDTTMETDGSSQ